MAYKIGTANAPFRFDDMTGWAASLTNVEGSLAAHELADGEGANQAGALKGYKVTRADTAANSGFVDARYYKGTLGVDAECTVIDSVFSFKVDAGMTASNSVVPNLLSISSQTAVQLRLQAKNYTGTDLVFDKEFLLAVVCGGTTIVQKEPSPSVTSYPDNYFVTPMITPGCWHQIRMRTSGWGDAVTVECWIDGEKVMWSDGTYVASISPGTRPQAVYIGYSANNGGGALAVETTMWFDDFVFADHDLDDDDGFAMLAYALAIPSQYDNTVNIVAKSTVPASLVVEYGTTTAYGSEAVGIATPDDAQAFHAQLTGLVPGQEYHYRFVITNAGNENDVFTSWDHSFTFQPAASASHEAVIFADVQEYSRRVSSFGFAKKLHPDVAIVGQVGDLTDVNSWTVEEYADIAKRASAWGRSLQMLKGLSETALACFTPGNHDMSPNWHEGDPASDHGAAWYAHFPVPGSRRVWAYDHGYARYIMLDLGFHMTGSKATQFAELERLLEESEKPWNIILCQYCAFGDDESVTSRDPIEQRSELHDILKAHPTCIFVSGDINQYYVWQMDGVWYVSAGTPCYANSTSYPLVADGDFLPRRHSSPQTYGYGGYLHLTINEKSVWGRYHCRGTGKIRQAFVAGQGRGARVTRAVA